MTAPKETVWDLDPHTRAKHEILRRYLQAWTPILTQSGFDEVMYVDGFAGPGRYSKGEDGSPVIALRAALNQHAHIGANIRFVFIEESKDRAGCLQEIVCDFETPDNFQIEVYPGKSFEEAFGEILQSYQGRHLPPTFAFIDPFGWSGVPFSMIRKIMSHTNCEVFVNFMYEEINRFLSHRNQKSNFDVFFGTDKWREGTSLHGSRQRKNFLHELYRQQLQSSADAKYVRSFEMKNVNNVVDYYLFYATNNILGLKKMKEAMWHVDPEGEFTFSDATNPDQTVLFANKPRFEMLKNQLLERFGGCDASIEEIENFVVAETAFRETHYKKHVLKPLERAKLIEIVDPPLGRKRGTYPDRFKSMKLRFPPSSS